MRHAPAIFAASLLTISCAASWGAPNDKTPAYDLQCGADTCDYRYYECSVSKPTRCEYVGDRNFGKARDAGVPPTGDAATP